MEKKTQLIWLMTNDFVYIVSCPPDGSGYFYARELLNISDDVITIWNTIAYNLNGFGDINIKIPLK